MRIRDEDPIVVRAGAVVARTLRHVNVGNAPMITAPALCVT
jgi:hypothetical protein